MYKPQKVTIDPTAIPPHAINTLARAALNGAEAFYQDHSNIRKFIAWHIKRYGHQPSNIDRLNTVLEAGTK